MAASGSQQQPAAAAVVGRTSSSRASGPRAKLSSPQLPLHAPQPFLPAQPPALLQPTTLPAVAPNSRAGGIPDSILQANGTAAGSSRLQVSSAGQTVSASTGQAPDSTSAADDDAAPSSGAAEPSTGSSPAEETVDMPADQVPPVAGVSEKVLERAKQLEKDDKAAQSPGTVLPPTEEANRKQDEAQPQASSSSPDGSAPNSAASLAVLPEQATHMQSEQETGQAEGLTAASEGGAFTFDSAAADDVLKSALQANPFGDMLDSLLRHQPTSHKLSDLYTKPATVDDPVNRALQGVIAHAGQGAPKRGPVHDLLHIADAAHAPERRPAPALLSALLKAEETQAPTPKQGLVHDLLHLSARVSTLTDNLGEVIPLRADPIADSLKAVSSVTDWSAQKWDPLAMGLQAGLAERSKAQPQDNPIASLGTVEEHSPIKRPSKYDPLPGILTGAAPSAKRNLDPFSGLMALALARGNAREAARAKRMALAASYPQASPKSDPQEANGHSIVADREPRPDQRLHRRSNGEHAELNGHSSGASASNGASPRVIMSNGVHNAAMPSNGASKSNGAQNGKHADGAVQLADVTPASAGNGKVVHVEAPVLITSGARSNGANHNGAQKRTNGVAVKPNRRLVNVRVYQGNTKYTKGRSG